ncbi:MAG: hypothetical protein ACRD9L_09610, partial [Bryobacteraceae bacterium]
HEYDRILEVAVNGRAGLIVMGDEDLLTLKCFQNVQIITPAEHLKTPTLLFVAVIRFLCRTRAMSDTDLQMK